MTGQGWAHRNLYIEKKLQQFAIIYMSKMCSGSLRKADVKCLVYSYKDTAVNVVGPFTTIVNQPKGWSWVAVLGKAALPGKEAALKELVSDVLLLWLSAFALVCSVAEQLRRLCLVFTLAVVKCWGWELQHLTGLVCNLSNTLEFSDSNIHACARQIKYCYLK